MADPTPANTKRRVAMNSATYALMDVALKESPQLPNASFTIVLSLFLATLENYCLYYTLKRGLMT